ncbi:unnamed protein product [Ectocarpus sp. CCAP 1310/34]|nr:unnamed protein product [Ectocarpus sp. CCAP 1310/34]
MLHAVPVFPIVTTKVQPCLVITDTPCMLAPIADKNHPDLLDEGGALPRNAEGQVSLKGLQHIGARARDFPDLHSVKVPPGGFPSATASSALGAQPVHNVYAVYAAAEPSPGVQAQLDFRTLLGHHSDMVEKDRQLRAAPDAEGDVIGASDCRLPPSASASLRRTRSPLYTIKDAGREAAGREAAGREAAGRESAAGEAQGVGGERGGGADETPPEREIADLSTKELLDISGHLIETLRVAIGSTDAAGLTMMCMPEFLGDDVLYVLQSINGRSYRRSGRWHRGRCRRGCSGFEKIGGRRQPLPPGGAVDGIEEGVGEAAPVLRKLEDAVNLYHQMALSSDSLGGQLDKNGKLPGYGVSFNLKRERSFGEFGHFYDGQRVGLWLGPDGPLEGNHQGPCQMKYGGVSRCPQLTGVNCNVHEQNHEKKTKHLPSVSGMGFDTFTFNITLINELENVKINRKTCSVAVSSAIEHPHERLYACRQEVWTCGRCFCSEPYEVVRPVR